MEQEVYAWIKNIVVYLIINTIIMNLLGNKSYKKYVSIVSGMILVLIVISPIIKLMNIDENLEYYLESNEFAIEASDFKNDLYQMEKEQSNVIFAEYEEKIKVQVKELLLKEEVYLESIKITLNKDTGSTAFGEIISMDIKANTENYEQEDSEKLLPIDEINISPIRVGEDAEEALKSVPSPLEINVKNKLSDFYNMEQGNINISIQGG